MKKEKELTFSKTVNLRKSTLDNLDFITNRTDLSATGVMRVAIDYLYYSMSGKKMPSDLQGIIDDLKNEIK